MELGATATVQHVTFSNGGNGRTFYFRWGATYVIHLTWAPYLTFEDFEIGYNSTVRPQCGSGSGASCAVNGVGAGTRSGSGFPRDTAGASYLLLAGAEASLNSNTPGLTMRRGRFVAAQGDEAMHISSPPLSTGTNPASCSTVADCTQTALGTAVLCTGATCYYHDDTTSGAALFEDLEFAQQPWEVANGDTATYGYAYSWPPPGYSGWSAQYPTHFSPLGGGGETPGAFIIQTMNNTIRRIYVHDSSGMVRMENNNDSGSRVHCIAAGNLIEDSTFDGTKSQYAGPGGSAAIPVCATCKCRSTSNCAGFGNNAVVRDNTGGWDIDEPGNIWRNNVFRNCYGGCFRTTAQGGSHVGRATAPQFVNNTIQAIGDHARAGMNNERFRIDDKWGTSDAPGIVKNNIIVQENLGTKNTVFIDPGVTSTVTVDNNLYGPSNMRWKWGGNSSTTAFATWKLNCGQDANSPVPADPLFRGAPLDVHIAAVSPAVNAGRNLAGFSNDHDGVARPQGVAWDIGAYEVLAAPDPPTLRSVTPLP
jgi:hypothetical protein